MSQLLAQSSMLAVGMPDRIGATSAPRERIEFAMTAHETIQRLRLMRYDLLLTGTAVPDMPWGNMIRRVRALWPSQRWALLAPQLEISDEVAARALGAVAILQQWPDSDVLNGLLDAAHQASHRRLMLPTGAESAPTQRRGRHRVPV